MFLKVQIRSFILKFGVEDIINQIVVWFIVISVQYSIRSRKY